MSIGPPPTEHQYNHQLPGVYGQFGTGAGVHAFYLQSALTPSQLDLVSLISDLRGSERWPVRELFQRDVDNERITGSLLPYLQDGEKIKFFNPLTLILLPISENDDSVLSQMPMEETESTMQEGGYEWDFFEKKDYHRMRWVKDNPQYALLEWSDTRTKLVAIDGQHRLSALKRFWADHEATVHKDFSTWRIPVVIISFRVGTRRTKPPSVLEVVRNIFVYINTQARIVNRARQILLSDESVNAVCAQELIQLSHDNDLLQPEERVSVRLPLLFYDWRGEESEKQRIHAPASVKGVEEICDWFEHYVIGEDFSDDQETALGITPVHYSLKRAFYDEKLNHADSRALRELVREELLPAVSHLLENFTPYRSYVEALHELEREYEDEALSDLARHAFYELRFGTNLAPESIKPKVQEALANIKSKIEEIKKERLHTLVSLDIGMRGVVCAFGSLRRCFYNPEWLAFAEWFTRALNLLYKDEWLDLHSSRRRKFLLHVVEDHNESIVNYRLEDAEHALGAYLQLLVVAYGQPIPEEWTVNWPASKEELLDRLESRILRGYKRECRPRLRPEHPNGGKQLTDAVNREAGKLTGKQLRRFERELEKIEDASKAD
ncbi:MAG: hypothetical protein F4X75_21875 [Gemmatimonadetes bacterium]|nr:hypothetical protein [Gemmatimonadota bacterium]